MLKDDHQLTPGSTREDYDIAMLAVKRIAARNIRDAVIEIVVATRLTLGQSLPDDDAERVYCIEITCKLIAQVPNGQRSANTIDVALGWSAAQFAMWADQHLPPESPEQTSANIWSQHRASSPN